MPHTFTFLLLLILTISNSTIYCANSNFITWKGVYYHAISNQSGDSSNFCNQHVPGAFIHTIESALSRPIITDKGIKLDHARFHVKKENGVYLIEGSFIATGITNNHEWKDKINYHLYKLTELGETRGVWTSNKCKGLYRGTVVNKTLPSLPKNA